MATRRPPAVMIVEDDPDHAELLRRALAERGVATTQFADGVAALAHLRTRRDPDVGALPDVVLLDLRLGGEDGLEVLAAIRADPRLASLPVVVVSASDATEDLVRAYGLYANSYLVKPADGERFRRMLDAIGGYWVAWNRPLPAVPPA